MTRYAISQPVTQVEAPRLLTGQACYTGDVSLLNQAHAFFLRSPHAHADITRLNTTMAKSLPGVLTILTGLDYESEGLGEVTGASPAKKRDGSKMFRPHRPALNKSRVFHVGQAIAIVIAETIDQAKDAAEQIDVEYAPLPVHTDTSTANLPETAALRDECPDNEALFAELGDKVAVDAAIAQAAHVIRDRFVVNRVTANTMEPRAIVAEYEKGIDKFTIYACLQRPYIWRTLMTKHVFGIPEHSMRLIAGDVGGSFGMKGGLYIEVPLVAWASKHVGRPVKWTCERSEGHISDDQGRDMVIDGELALDSDGKFLGIRLASRNNVGAFITMIGFLSTPGVTRQVNSVYKTPAVHGMGSAVMTNTVPVSNYRGPGGTPGVYVHERLVDMAAQELGIDPVEIRRRNLIPAAAMPYSLPSGGAYDCGEFEAVMDKCLVRSGYAGVASRIMDAKAEGMLRGVGVSTTVDPSAGPSPETAEVRFDPGGNVTVLVGSTAGGQSHATIYTQILSDMLKLDGDNIRIVEGDTDKLSWGTGTGAARTATIGGTAVFKATEKVIEKGRKIAAHILETAEVDIKFFKGAYLVSGTDLKIDFLEVARIAFQPDKLPDNIEIGLFETATWTPESGNTPNSCHVCEVEIDPDTGQVQIIRYTAVHDVGVELNPLLVNGQVHGGIAQGAGQALMENMIYDEKGQVLTGSLLDYAMPRAEDFCQFDIESHPVATDTNPLGVKGAGECGTVGSLAAVMNAINHALAPVGVENIGMPATPDRVWHAIQDAAKS
jgi:carbon-monoxide dehydrogenase large subunit